MASTGENIGRFGICEATASEIVITRRFEEGFDTVDLREARGLLELRH